VTLKVREKERKKRNLDKGEEIEREKRM